MPEAPAMHIDKGLDNTVIGESRKSFIDGQTGVLEYVGIDIDDHHVARALSSKPPGKCTSDAAGSAGHNRDRVLDLHLLACSNVPVIR